MAHCNWVREFEGEAGAYAMAKRILGALVLLRISLRTCMELRHLERPRTWTV